jgi:uncharacterized protein YjbI with pentapeptide repeats
MVINWNDVWQAIRDVHLEILITGGALVILFIGGLLLLRLATRLNHRANFLQPEKFLPIKDTLIQAKRLKNYPTAVTTKTWIQQQEAKANIPSPMPLPFEPQFTNSKSSKWWANFWQGISTEFFGVVVTTIFLGILILIAQQYQSIRNRKSELILQMGSPDNTTAIEAVRQLRSLGWIEDGTLRGANLEGANLRGANLINANLDSANLRDANLQRANLWSVNLQNAELWYANLQEIEAGHINLQGSNLGSANLQGAYLRDANLQNTDLTHANLQNADLMNVNLQSSYFSSANLEGALLRYSNLHSADLWGTNLQDADLQMANLQNTELANANLQRADLIGVNLQSSNLQRANLQDAYLEFADLQDSNLSNANLQNTYLREANLRNANLQRANLQDSFLWIANLEGANLAEVTFSRMTLLPSGEFLIDENGSLVRDVDGSPLFTPESYYNNSDMERYTNQNHPDFWDGCLMLQFMPEYCI